MRRRYGVANTVREQHLAPWHIWVSPLKDIRAHGWRISAGRTSASGMSGVAALGRAGGGPTDENAVCAARA